MDQENHTYTTNSTNDSDGQKGTKTSIVLFIGFLIILLIVVLYFVLRRSPAQPEQTIETGIDQQEQEQPSSDLPSDDRTVSLMVSSSEPTSGGANFEVKLMPDEEVTISAVAFRLIYSYESGENLVPEDFTVSGNNLLTENDWSFPVSSVSVNEDENTVYFDFAAINVSTEGYTFDDEIEFATIISSSVDIDNSKLRFDETQTKVITKDAKTLNIDLVLE